MNLRDMEEQDSGPLVSKEGVIRYFETRGMTVMSRCHLSEGEFVPEPRSPLALREAAKPIPEKYRWVPFAEMAEATGKPLYYVAYLVSTGKVSGSMRSKKGSLSSLEAHLESRKSR